MSILEQMIFIKKLILSYNCIIWEAWVKKKIEFKKLKYFVNYSIK